MFVFCSQSVRRAESQALLYILILHYIACAFLCLCYVIETFSQSIPTENCEMCHMFNTATASDAGLTADTYFTVRCHLSSSDVFCPEDKWNSGGLKRTNFTPDPQKWLFSLMSEVWVTPVPRQWFIAKPEMWSNAHSFLFKWAERLYSEDTERMYSWHKEVWSSEWKANSGTLNLHFHTSIAGLAEQFGCDSKTSLLCIILSFTMF